MIDDHRRSGKQTGSDALISTDAPIHRDRSVQAAARGSAVVGRTGADSIKPITFRTMAIPTSLVGSYAQPDWLIDRERLRDRFPPRVRARELWRIDPLYLQ